MNNTKSFIPCLYLYEGKAVKSPHQLSTLKFEPLAEALRLTAYADGLQIVDLTRRVKGDAEEDKIHDETIARIREICETIRVPVIASGNIRRMEDVKKLVYADCSQVVLDLNDESNRAILQEVSQRFGRDRIVVSCDSLYFSKLPEEEITAIKDCASGVILTDGHLPEDDSAAGGDSRDGYQIKSFLGGDNAGSASAANAAASGTSSADTAAQDFVYILSREIITIDKLFGFFTGQVNQEKTLSISAAAVTGYAINENLRELRGIKSVLKDNGINVNLRDAAFTWSDFKKGPDGLLTVVVQEDSTDELLMVAYMNEQAYRATIETGLMNYYSRSRGEQWLKGETSGHFQFVVSLTADCDMDTLLARVIQIGPACHTGSHSCFFQKDLPDLTAEAEESADSATVAAQLGTKAGTTNHAKSGAAKTSDTLMDVLEQDFASILDRKVNPKEGSYTNYLFDKGIDKMLKKLGEESTEIVIAAKNPDTSEIVYEIADYLYHLLVVMAERGVTLEEIREELSRRQKKDKEG